MKLASFSAIISAFILAGSSSAFATPITITPGMSGVIPTAITAGTQGTQVAMTSGTATATNNAFSINYTEYVYEGGANAICPTCLAFGVVVTDLTANDDIVTLGMSSFSGYATEVAYIASPTTAAPSSVNRSTTGNTINYQFGAGFGPYAGGDATTDLLLIFTNATSDNNLGALVAQEGGNTTSVDFQPVGTPTITPEPSSLMLLGTGILGIAGAARRKYKGR